MTRIIARLIVGVLVLMASFAVAELGLRMVPLEKTTYRDTAIDRSRRVRWPKVDFRNRSYQSEKAPGVFRIMVLGDSYTWGSGLHPEDAYPDRLEHRLGDLVSDIEFEVVNWSRPGWNTDREWQSIRKPLSFWSPDLLILGFVFNDAELENLTREQWARIRAQVPDSGLGGWLYGHSRAVSGLYDVFENRRVRERLVDYHHGLFEDPEGWQKCLQALANLRDRAAGLEIPFLVVVFPIFNSQLDENYRYHELHRLMRQTTAEMGIESLDLRRAYRRIDPNRLAVTPFTDPHPSEFAQRIAADAIMNELLRREWIPAKKADPPGRRTGRPAAE